MLAQIRPALVLLTVMTLLTGVVYPLFVTAAGQALFPRQAGSSLIVRDGVVVGSQLVGQQFDRPEYFHGRPSAVGYDAASSGATNLGPTNRQLIEAVGERARVIVAETGLERAPVDIVTSSASGLDPDISPESAYLQVKRVAEARGIPAIELRRMVEGHLERPLLGIFGKPAVNVLMLNLTLDERARAGHNPTESTNGAGAEQ